MVTHLRELTWQQWVWPAGFVFDLLTLAFIFPEASWRWVLGWRLLGSPLQPIAVHYAKREPLDEDLVWLLAYGYAVLSVLIMALQGLFLGGWESPWILGTLGFTFAGSLVAELRPARVTHIVIVWISTWTAVLVVGSAWVPGVAAQMETPRSPIYFAGLWAIVAAVAGGSVHFGRRIASLRRELHAARQLARYRLQSRIGVGGMNEVWLAWDDAEKRSVALKILRREPTAEAIRRFHREAEALRALSSEHTVRVYEHGASDDGVLYIAMEHLDGLDLDRLVRERGALHPARAVSLIRQACASLAEAHARGIVHRDIKPSNLFLTRHERGGDRLKVIDFGVARQLADDESRITLDGDAVGTPHYMAPESFHGVDGDGQVDVYGLGATLYFLLTARRPFEGRSGAGLLAAVASAPVAPPSEFAHHEVSPGLDALVLRAVSRDRARRFASVTELDEALAELQVELLDALLDADRSISNDLTRDGGAGP